MKNEIRTYGKSILFEDSVNARAIVTYLALFNEYVIEWCNEWFESDSGKFLCFHYTSSNEKRKVVLKSKELVEEFCTEHNLIVVENNSLDHPLAHGLPDCRSIH